MVVCDIAETMVNEDNIVCKTVQKAISEIGFNFTLAEVLARVAGKEKLKAIKSVLATFANNTDERLAEEILSNFSKQLIEACQHYPLYSQSNVTEPFAPLSIGIHCRRAKC